LICCLGAKLTSKSKTKTYEGEDDGTMEQLVLKRVSSLEPLFKTVKFCCCVWLWLTDGL